MIIPVVRKRAVIVKYSVRMVFVSSVGSVSARDPIIIPAFATVDPNTNITSRAVVGIKPLSFLIVFFSCFFCGSLDFSLTLLFQ